MPNPLDALKKMKGKSWTELRTRGEQLLAARTDQIGLSGNLPDDRELFALIDDSFFGGETPNAADLLVKFYEDAEYNFFPAFRCKSSTTETFQSIFGAESANQIIERAEKIVAGRFDLLGYENLDFGDPIDWHLEPLSGKISPKKHWKQFDELDAAETGDKKIVWELNRQQYFFDLGAAFWLTGGKERFAKTFVRHLNGWMEENPPGAGVNWVSSLEVSFRAISWIWAFNFFKEAAAFTPDVFHNALKFIYSHGRHLEKYLSTFYSPNTHLTGEALGLYYLGTQFSFFKSARGWRETGKRILYAELDRQILADGVYFEQSTWYQRYTADFYTHFFILQTLNETVEDAALTEKLKDKLQSLTDFLMFVTRPDGTTPLLGDDDGGRMLPHSQRQSDDFRPVLSTNAILFERGDYKFVARDLAQESVWLLGGRGAEKFADLTAEKPSEKSKSFAAGGYFVMRGGWDETDDYLLVDCGEVGALSGGHGHADALALDLSVGGKTVLTDSGTYSYHESEATRRYFRSTTAHNALTVDGESQSQSSGKFNWKTRANAGLRKWIAQPRFDFFSGSHDGYGRLDAPATHRRDVLFLKNDYWIVRDFVETSGTHDYALDFHFDRHAEPSVGTTNSGAKFVGETESRLRLFTFGDNGDWRKKSSPISKIYGEKFDAPHFQFVSKGVGAQEFFTFFLPNETAPPNAPEVFEVELSGGRAFVVKFRSFQDLFVFADGGQIVRTEFFNTNFRCTWARLSAGEAAPEEFVLIGGTHFSLGKREIVNQMHELDFAAAQRSGDKLNVQTAETFFNVSLPQKKSAAYVLKNRF